MFYQFLLSMVVLLIFTGNSFTAIRARIIPTQEELTKFLVDANADIKSKLIFHNDGSLYFIDFSESSPQITEVSSAHKGVLPVISPDGNYFVFAKGVTGDGEEKQPCTSYICQLSAMGTPVQVATPAYVPRFIQNAIHPTVLYSTCARHPDNAKFTFKDGCGAVLKKPFINDQFPDVDTVWPHGSYFGGLSWDEKYLGTAWLGSGNAYVNNIKSINPELKMIHLKAKNNQINTDTIFEIGACNPSISSSRKYTDAMLFIDYGYSKKIPSAYTFPYESTWEQHEFLFISNYNGDIYRRIGQKFIPELSPDHYQALSYEQTNGQSFNSAWDYPEWSNHPYLGVATITVTRTWKGSLSEKISEETSLCEHIALVNLKTQNTLILVSTTDSTQTTSTHLKWPWFWTKIPEGFIEESDWLSTQDAPQLIRSTHNKSSNRSIRIVRDVIQSEKIIKSVSIYTLNGSCLLKENVNAKSFTLPTNITSNKMILVYVSTELPLQHLFKVYKF